VIPRTQGYLLTARTSSDWLLKAATSMTAVHACEPSYSSSLWILRTRRVHHHKTFVRMPIMALPWTGTRAGITLEATMIVATKCLLSEHARTAAHRIPRQNEP
jgi:hypothetical protein